MQDHTLFNKTLQLTGAAVRARRKRCEQAMRSNWNADASHIIDACLHVEEALASLVALEAASTLATPAKAPAQWPSAQVFGKPRLVPRAWKLNGSTVRTRSYSPRQETTGFESVGSIIPRVIRGIEAAAGNNRPGGPR